MIGVLALQGAFIEHSKILDKMGIENIEIRQSKDLCNKLDGLIIPGGESTTIGKLLHELNLFEPIKKLIDDGLPVMGTCAGLILLSKEISNDSRSYLKSIDIKTVRNAYGRQLGSFKTNASFNNKEIPMVFIRAPYIEKVLSDKVKVLSVVNDHIVAVREDNKLATSFHPELTDDFTVHEYFINMVNNK